MRTSATTCAFLSLLADHAVVAMKLIRPVVGSSSRHQSNSSERARAADARRRYGMNRDAKHVLSIALVLGVVGVLFLLTLVASKMWNVCKHRFCPQQQNSSSEWVSCYLCGERVLQSEWNDTHTGHRWFCARKTKRHRDLLCDMARSDVRCSSCGDNLRVWPNDLKGRHNFTCSDSLCGSLGVEQANSGSNRFNCFACDVDVCAECAHRTTHKHYGISAIAQSAM